MDQGTLGPNDCFGLSKINGRKHWRFFLELEDRNEIEFSFIEKKEAARFQLSMTELLEKKKVDS